MAGFILEVWDKKFLLSVLHKRHLLRSGGDEIFIGEEEWKVCLLRGEGHHLGSLDIVQVDLLWLILCVNIYCVRICVSRQVPATSGG